MYVFTQFQGDSGGPLVMRDQQRTVQVGLVSAGLVRSCNTANPTVFTSIAHYLDFIRTETQNDYRGNARACANICINAY